MQYARGVILHGPPGTGKTSTILYVFRVRFSLVDIDIFLFSRALCEYLGLKPKVINGPQLLDSLLGSSERAVRKLFEEAIDDQINVSDDYCKITIQFDHVFHTFRKVIQVPCM